MPRGAALEIPATLIGSATTIPIAADTHAAGAWMAHLQALEIDASAVVVAPGVEAVQPVATGKWTFRRRRKESGRE
jgi:hypothetical protein